MGLWNHSQGSYSLASPRHMVCITWLLSKVNHCYAASFIRKAGHSPAWMTLQVISLSDDFCPYSLSVLLGVLRVIKVQACRMKRVWNNVQAVVEGHRTLDHGDGQSNSFLWMERKVHGRTPWRREGLIMQEQKITETPRLLWVNYNFWRENYQCNPISKKGLYNRETRELETSGSDFWGSCWVPVDEASSSAIIAALISKLCLSLICIW